MSFETLDRPLQGLGLGFKASSRFGSQLESVELHIALRRLSLYTLAVDDYQASSPSAFSLAILGELRNFTRHSFMSLNPNVRRCAQNPRSVPTIRVHLQSIVHVPHPGSPIPGTRLGHQDAAFDPEPHERLADSPELMMSIMVMASIGSVGLDER